VGAVIGGLHTAARAHRDPVVVAHIALVFGVGVAGVALAPNLVVALLALTLVGGAGTSFLAFSNSLLQMNARSGMRGRIMALRAVAFLGTRPLGAPLIGWIGEYIGPRHAVATGAIAALLVAGWGWRRLAPMDAVAPD
jgi:MFS family permease